MDKETIAAVAGGFSRMANGEATIPPILRIDVPDNNGEVAQDWHR
jgi:ornithine cyclodeaminase